MDAFKVSFEVVAPLLILMAVGVLVRAVKLLSAETFSKMNRLIFFIGIPALVFQSIVTSSLSFDGFWGFSLWIIIAFALVFALLLLVVPRFEKDNRRRGVLVQGMVRSNDAVFGLAVAAAFPGENSLAVMAFAAALSVPVLNAIGVISMEVFRGERVKPLRLMLDILKNPIIIAVILGFIVKLSGLTLPKIIMVPVGHLANMCTPLAFIILGGILTRQSFMDNRKTLSVVCIFKLVVLPLLAVGAALLFGYRGDMLLAILILFGAPTAMSSFPLAAAMGGDEALAGEQVAVTTALSLFSMFLFLFFMQLGGVL
ncbi:MAG: AEC family transporter [Clostridia bacterium]|nr:AEC family transporter [Clostridia bacterium]